MGITRRKALYIYLSSILGILLFSMFHRSIFVMYEIIGNFYPEISWLHLPFRIIATVDFFSFVLAIFLGGWYGVWIGLSWYKMIYEERGVKTWFHGFVPHNWRKTKSHNESSSELDFINSVAKKTVKTSPRRIVVTSESKPSKRVETFRSFRTTTKAAMPWDTEDAELEPKAVKKVTRRTTTSISRPKTVRKTVAKKKVTV